MQVDLCPTRPV